MANWTDISDAVLEPGKPIRSVDGIALRDNPIAMAEGAAGAPRIEQAALASNSVSTAKIVNSNVTAAKLATGTGERDWVGARYAALALGAVGSYGLFLCASTTDPGETRSGSALQYTNASGNNTGPSPSGTWMCMGVNVSGVNTASATTLWKRVS